MIYTEVLVITYKYHIYRRTSNHLQISNIQKD